MVSLEAFGYISVLYENLIGASINLEILQHPLHTAEWAQYLFGLSKPDPTTNPTMLEFDELDASGECDWSYESDESHDTLYTEVLELHREPSENLCAMLSCIAMCESGEYNVDPRQLKGVIALSAGDSIFAASALVSDPAEASRNGKPMIQRLFGNLGRSELAFLVPPSAPKLMEYNPADWNMINHEPFDGTFQDSFQGTSLHLSFTDFEMPVDIGVRGLRDTQVILLESLISVDHCGKSVGDINVISLFNSARIISQCKHRSVSQAKSSSGNDLVSLDCWEEFFDLPAKTGLFRAHGNWQARLAAAAASVQRGMKTLVLPQNACLDCLRHMYVLNDKRTCSRSHRDAQTGYDVVIV
ncbi:hypothetical protein M426DRAFT_10107 [Hypoxylon sp. CI-4A]|nr:hypothetical protein M426DRAFT_10107 [Hypoxylon sp. CI-4A]